jgi:hypothetical protein
MWKSNAGIDTSMRSKQAVRIQSFYSPVPLWVTLALLKSCATLANTIGTLKTRTRYLLLTVLANHMISRHVYY